MEEKLSDQQEQKGLHQEGSERSIISMLENVGSLAVLAVVMSYVHHLTVAAKVGYPIVLIAPSSWDFLVGLLRGLPLLFAVCFYLVRVVWFSRDLMPDGSSKTHWYSGYEIPAYIVLVVLMMIAFVAVLFVALTYVGANAAAENQVISAVLVVVLGVVAAGMGCSSASNGTSPLLVIMTNALAAGGLIAASAFVVAWLESSRCESGALMPVLPPTVIAEAVILQLFMDHISGSHGFHELPNQIEIAREEWKNTSIWAKFCVMLIVAFLLAFASGLFATPSDYVVGKLSEKGGDITSAVETQYRVVDIFGGSRVVAVDGGNESRFYVFNLEDGYYLERG